MEKKRYPRINKKTGNKAQAINEDMSLAGKKKMMACSHGDCRGTSAQLLAAHPARIGKLPAICCRLAYRAIF